MIDIERTYWVQDGAERRDVVVRWRSVPDDHGVDACVAVEITGVEEAWSTKIYGIDDVQGLQLALGIARVKLEKTRAFEEDRLKWYGEDLGLPVTPTPSS